MRTDTLEIAYQILYNLEHKKKTEYMGTLISPEQLDADPEKWREVVESLVDEGYISGIRFWENICGEQKTDIEKAKITLKGAQYLKENSQMAKFGRIATNVITTAATTAGAVAAVVK